MPVPKSAVRARTVSVRRSWPHADLAFTQGLTVAFGRLWESVGLYGSSRLREMREPHGEVQWSADLPEGMFAEGIARAPAGLWQLTWRERVAVHWDVTARRVTAEVPYEREGWGACLTPMGIVTSDGSDELVVRDPVTLRPRWDVAISFEGQPVLGLNDLEWAHGRVWANLYGVDRLVAIDVRTGVVTDLVDASALRRLDGAPAPAILNGIAYSGSTGLFYVTGKTWSSLFEVAFELAAHGAS